MTSKYKVRVICGFRKDQQFIIDSNEAHRAYYLFLNPDKRGVFSNGVALVGADIRRIEPDYHSAMGWNEGHELTADDWAQIRAEGLEDKYRDILAVAKRVAEGGDRDALAQPLLVEYRKQIGHVQSLHS